MEAAKSCINCDRRWYFDNKEYPCRYASLCYPNSDVLTYGNKSEIDKYWIKRKEEQD